MEVFGVDVKNKVDILVNCVFVYCRETGDWLFSPELPLSETDKLALMHQETAELEYFVS